MTIPHRRAGLGAVIVLVAALILIGLTWFGTLSAVDAETREARARVAADVSNQALVFENQLRRELLVLEQTLRILEHEWEADPAGFNLLEWRKRTLVLPDLALHMFLTDAQGIIRSSTRPELIGLDVGGRDYFRAEAHAKHDDGSMFISPSTRGLVTNRWQMNMARRLDNPDGAFAGVIVISYDTSSLTRFFRKADLGENGLIALVGTEDGLLRALVGPAVAEPGLDISKSAMFAAMTATPSGRWIGPSALDGVKRIHAFRPVPNRQLGVVLAFDLQGGMPSSIAFSNGALIFASGTTLFIIIIAAGVLREREMARQREAQLDRDRATLAAANSELAIARMRADAKTAQLEATLTGMSDGVSMFDPALRLVAWNALFAEFTGVPADMLEVGLPLEQILRLQAERGEFGPGDVEQTVAHRMALHRSDRMPRTSEEPRPGGRIIELRRSDLPGGGFVTLYTDITGRKLAEDAMRRARELAEAATEAKSRFVATVSHEILTPLNTLLNSLRLLADTEISASQGRLVNMARQAGDGLFSLMTDILEMSKMEAGRLTLRPSLFALRPLLEGVTDLFRNQAGKRGISLSLAVGADVPKLIHSDSGRVRQILTNLMSNAVKFAASGEVVLIAETVCRDEALELRLIVRDPGPALSAADRARLFQPFARLDRAHEEATPGTGLGLSICQSLAALMGAEMGCAASPEDGNDFWLVLPLATMRTEAVPRPEIIVPRTRVLLVEDVLPNQLVTAMMLRRAGHMVDVAQSGLAAVEAVTHAPYDVVLMDVFMPGMSGLEATHRIRALDGVAGAVPIIALTANAGAEDRARYLQAGMNDVVAKPVEAGNLLDVIAHHVWAHHVWAAPSTRPGGGLVDPRRAAMSAPATLSSSRIAELRANLAPTVLAELVEACLAELAVRLSDLRGSLAAGDVPAVEQQAHAMVGLAGGYGLAALEGRLRAVLQPARVGRLDAARAASVGLEEELNRAAPALRASLSPELAES